MNFSEFKFNKNNVPKEILKKEAYFLELEKQFYKEVLNSEAIAEYKRKYEAESVKNFASHYARRKTSLTRYYENYLRHEEKKLNGYRQETEEMLNLIRQKKLFNLQLQWRANQIKLEGVRVTIDFLYWSEHIKACPFIAPISNAEIMLMQEYLRKNIYEDHSRISSHGLQDYDSFKGTDEGILTEEMPEFYEFYDLHMNTGTLLLLPDLRGPAEEKYLNLVRKEKEKQRENTPPKTKSAAPQLPYLYSSLEEIEKFSLKIETDKHFIELFRICIEQDKTEREAERTCDLDVDSAYYKLKEIPGKIPIPAADDWRTGMVMAINRHVNEMIIAHLKHVYEEDAMFRDLGIGKQAKESPLSYTHWVDNFREDYCKMILRGRELNGEPADFDF